MKRLWCLIAHSWRYWTNFEYPDCYDNTKHACTKCYTKWSI